MRWTSYIPFKKHPSMNYMKLVDECPDCVELNLDKKNKFSLVWSILILLFV